MYDPYRDGADFVRGYPFSLREGVPTAVSHGLWLNIPDYDAPTQLVKPLERNTRSDSKRGHPVINIIINLDTNLALSTGMLMLL